MLRKAIVRATLFIAVAVAALLLASNESVVSPAAAGVVGTPLAAIAAP